MSSPRVSPSERDSRSASPVIATANRFTFGAMANSSSSSEDDEILRPRGRLAARLLQRNANREGSGSETEKRNGSHTEEDEAVRGRLRKLVQRRQRSNTTDATTKQAEGLPDLSTSSAKPAASSPGLFVTPSKPRSPAAGSDADAGSDSDDADLPHASSLTKNARFAALVEKKQRERKAREADEARKKTERLAAQAADDDVSMGDDEDDNITDDDGGRKLTQEGARPSRKASKKALEDMSRETQRLARSMQLAHEAKVKKKISKSALFERFNFRPGRSLETPKLPSSQPTTPGSGPRTDAEMKDADTPPSSPPHSAKQDVQRPVPAPAELEEDSDGELPTLSAALEAAAMQKKLDKGKGKATAANFEAEDRAAEHATRSKRNFRVRLPEIQANVVTVGQGDGDDDLVVKPSRKNKLDAIFDRVPVNQAKESRPMHVLRKLAHLDDPEKKAGTAPAAKNRFQKQQQPSMTVGELQATLLERARVQAKLERDRHLEMLRSKGIHIQTAEEREKEEQEVDDIIARARQEAEEIMAREREAAKKDRKARREAGEEDPLGWDDSDGSDFGTENEKEEGAELELSGSEEDEADEATDADEESEEADPAGGLIDNAAESAEESEDGDAEDQLADQDEDEDLLPSLKKDARRRPRKQFAILSDDEDEDPPERIVEATPRPKTSVFQSPAAPKTDSPKIPTSVLRSATKAFIPGLPVAAGGPAGLGLTQIFAGTMDESQAASTLQTESQPQPKPTFDVQDFPDSNFSQTAHEAGEDTILDSQPAATTQGAETQGVQLNFSQSQAHGFDTLLRDNQGPSQMSEPIEPTQDEGYHNYSPLLHRFVDAPASTAEAVKIRGMEGDVDHAESPLVRRTGKLRRQAVLIAAASASDDEGRDEDAAEDIDEADEFGFGIKTSAFSVMKKAAIKENKKTAETFDKKKSKAREMVEEQAEESEDEYAGLGGVDGEDSSDDDAESVKEMIDDETKNNETDERKLAAFYADRERASDEKQVEKLFHDITTGQLRRKRGGDWDDLSDSDDGGEARRRLKRRQFAKMQRALFADERISKVAENPRNQAFLRTIEDHGSDDEMDFIFAPAAQVPGAESQDLRSAPEREATTIPDSQPQVTSRMEDVRPPAHLRRTKDGKKPSNIGDIRESLSNLLGEPLNSSSVIPATELGSDSEDEAANRDSHPSPSHSTTSAIGSGSSNKENRNPRRGRVAVVDRISLKRNSSSSVSTSSTSRLAFSAGNSAASGGFKVPALLRRATTNSLMSSSSSASTSSTGVTTHNGSGSGFAAERIKKPAGKRSGVNYFARENERRAAVAEMERRREARKVKGAKGRSKAVGGLFGAGKFE